jgi:iron complex transport system ATP-binding protein
VSEPALTLPAAADAPAVLVLAGVAVVRDRTTILADVDWTVREGERWVVLGPNGAGKTTLLQIASASAFPTRGSVELLGERFGATDLGELRTRIGLSSAPLAEADLPADPVQQRLAAAARGVPAPHLDVLEPDRDGLTAGRSPRYTY